MENWIDVSKTSGGQGETEVEVTAAPNPGPERTTTLTAKTAAGTTAELNITQQAPPYFLNLALNYANAATGNTRKNFFFVNMEWGTNSEYLEHPYPKFYTSIQQGLSTGKFFPVMTGLISPDFFSYVREVMTRSAGGRDVSFQIVLNLGGQKYASVDYFGTAISGYGTFAIEPSSAIYFSDIVGNLASEQIKVYLVGTFTIPAGAVSLSWLLASYSIQVR